MLLFRRMLKKKDLINPEHYWEAHKSGYTCLILYDAAGGFYHFNLNRVAGQVYDSLSNNEKYPTFQDAAYLAEKVLFELSYNSKPYKSKPGTQK